MDGSAATVPDVALGLGDTDRLDDFGSLRDTADGARLDSLVRRLSGAGCMPSRAVSPAGG
jgi:hypothetical protein